MRGATDRRAGPGARRARPRRRPRSPGCAPTPATSRPRSWSTAPGSGPRPSARWPASTCRCTPPSTSTSSPRPSPACTRDLPILRDPDGYTYFKEEVGGLVIGGFEPEAKPWVAPDEIPYPFEFQLLDEDWEHFEILMDNALLRIPALEHTGIKKFYNGPESFTPDNQFILGEAPECANFFVGAGFNSVGIASAGGAGRALAEWIVNGAPTTDLTGGRHPPVRPVQRQHRVAARPGRRGARRALRNPLAQPGTRRPPGRSAARRCTTCCVAADANFGSRMGWERANFFAPPTAPAPVDRVHLGQAELAAVVGRRAAEHPRAASRCSTRPRSPSTCVVGPGRRAALQWLCTAMSRSPVGKSVYTGMLNERGTYESDVTVTRTGRAGVPDRQQRGHHRARQGPHPPEHARPARTPHWST